MDISKSPRIYGDVQSLHGLINMRWFVADAGSSVYGSSDALLAAIPTLENCSGEAVCRYDVCGTHVCPDDATPIIGAAQYIGSDDCSCCTGGTKTRDPAGVCMGEQCCRFPSYVFLALTTLGVHRRCNVHRCHVRREPTVYRWYLHFLLQRR